MRVLHVSDVHVSVPLSELPWGRMLNKRLLGALSHAARRARGFAQAPEKLRALGAFAAEHAVDLVIVTGDYTAVGTEPELAAARRAVDSLTSRPLGFVTLPGNHDVYLADSVRHGCFERYFGEFLSSDLPEYCVDGPWPLTRLVGDDVAVVAVNSARPNPQPWRSSGLIPDPQLAALSRVLSDARLANRFVFVATHYAPRRPDGTPDTRWHGLVNADALLAVCKPLKSAAILHGHIHHRYQLQVPGSRTRIFGAGSATYAGREGLWLFDVDATQAIARPGSFQGDRYVLLPDDAAIAC